VSSNTSWDTREGVSAEGGGCRGWDEGGESVGGGGGDATHVW
jgi:hypothetical protein